MESFFLLTPGPVKENVSAIQLNVNNYEQALMHFHL